ncbi:peptide N-acetyl-beta-D-glucosaminyl asparaginase amidase A-domain-containing protein [Lentinula edodes]|nr:peptide N-acetyl-beta-D-glucosaminyl asparaginase amidase A-domain-containing protein [Lentinula edodes]
MTISSHDFANSFVDGPAITQLSPPEDCGPVGSWAAITLNLTVTSNGTQFDRLGIFTFHNVEIWRTSTFEPTIGDGIVWTYIKDVTQYMPLFTESGEFLLELDNLIETGLDGIYSTTVAATYFESSAEYPPAEKADIIIPISTLSNTTADDASVPPAFSLNITVPNNTVAIYAEIFASGNGLEEDWFFNVPDEFFSNISPNITSPHDGGFIPSFWRPIGSYGIAELPTYFVDVTPFVPLLTDNSPHNFTLDVVSAEEKHTINSNWYVSVILDTSFEPTIGNMTVHSASNYADTSITGFVEDFGQFNATVTAMRNIHIEADILSGSGQLTHVIWTQDLQFSNIQTYRNNGLLATLKQTSTGNSSSTHNGVAVLSDVFSYPFSTNFDYLDETLSNWTSSIDHSYDRILLPNPLRIASTINNHQTTDGFFQLGSEKIGNFGNGTNNNTFSYSDVKGNTYTRSVNAINSNFNDTIAIPLDEIGGDLAH